MLYVSVDATTLPDASLIAKLAELMELVRTGPLNVTLIGDEIGTPVEPEGGLIPVMIDGLRLVTVGGVVTGAAAVVKDQDTGLIVFPAWSFAPLSVAV